ncbi:hypothetical protein ACO0LL_30380, partial [Undibacterium sp. TC4M20W]
RIFGELHIEGFDVSHTKDGFRWEEYEDEFLDLLKDAIESVDVDNKDELLKPGMTAQVRLVVGSRENVVRIPTAALRFARFCKVS